MRDGLSSPHEKRGPVTDRAVENVHRPTRDAAWKQYPSSAIQGFAKGLLAGNGNQRDDGAVRRGDLGEDTLTDAAGGRYQGYRTHYKWDIGAVLRDWRFVVRIANIDASDLAAGTEHLQIV